jgi:hypothetical protein
VSGILKEEQDMTREKEAKEQEQSLLQELCGADAPLYALLRSYLYYTPLAAVSRENLESLTARAEETGDFRPAIDKAIFEGSQNPTETERYVTIIRSLAAKAMRATEREQQERTGEANADRAASWRKKGEDFRLMAEKAAEVLAVATEFYNERLLKAEEDVRRQARADDRRRSEGEERAIKESERRGQAARKEERRKMSWRERREARRRDRTEATASEAKRRVREEKRSEAEEKERRIGEEEEAARKARKKERGEK